MTVWPIMQVGFWWWDSDSKSFFLNVLKNLDFERVQALHGTYFTIFMHAILTAKVLISIAFSH